MKLIRTATSGVAALLVATLIPGLAVAPAAGAAAADPMFEAPAVGACYDLSKKEGLARTHTEAPVDCAGQHTSLTLAVIKVPRRIKWRSDAADRYVGKKCGEAYESAIGGSRVTRLQTIYSRWVFAPTKAQERQGARWWRCDLSLWSDKGRRLPALPSKIRISKPLPLEITRCFDARNRFLPCSEPHVLRATGAAYVAKQPYWTQDEFVRNATRLCRGRVEGGRYAFTRSSEQAWKNGYRYVICYTRTTH